MCGIAVAINWEDAEATVRRLIAGILHVPKRGKNAQESLATWTDLIVGVAVLVLAVDVLVRVLAR